jgi:DNA-binding MarR family transcriptional regulator
LYLLGRALMKIGEDALPRTGLDPLPASVRSVLLDVFEHPNSSIGEIAARTGFPQSHVSGAVARLRAIAAALETTVDPEDRRRTLVRPSPALRRRASQWALPPANDALAKALGARSPEEIAEHITALETFAQRLIPRTIGRVPAED